MTALEKKQKLAEKLNQTPDQYIDNIDSRLDQILAAEQRRKERFNIKHQKNIKLFVRLWPNDLSRQVTKLSLLQSNQLNSPAALF